MQMKIIRKPIKTEAVKYTGANTAEIEAFCKKHQLTATFLAYPQKVLIYEKYYGNHRVYIGQWLVKDGRWLKVMDEPTFCEEYELIDE